MGQSIWLDYIRRSLITSGELRRLIEEDGLRGITSNPAIFEKAIAGSTDYADILAELQAQKLSATEIYERIAIRDIQDAADLLLPVYQSTKKRDGYVSLEVSPTLARNTQGSIEEARRLWKAVGRPNVMIKIPGTPEGLPAIRQLLSEGININVTLLFSQDAYVKVAEAYIDGLEALQKSGGDISSMACVASFFVSRIDSLVDSMLSARLEKVSSPKEEQLLRGLQGKVAIANAKQAYWKYSRIFSGPRWKALADKGAQTQRLLWASTSTKNPTYRDVMYVEELIGPDTVDTIPPATFDAFRDHGIAKRTLDANLEAADKTMADLETAGISMSEVTDKLLEEGIQLFADAFTKLLAAVEQKKKDPGKIKPKIQNVAYDLPAPLKQAVDAALKDWQDNGKMARLWKGDKTLWTNDDEDKWLGWLGVVESQVSHLQELNMVANSGFTHALLLGMGGSSLCPEVLKMTFGQQPGQPELHVLDSTDPAQIRAVEKAIDLAKTLFIVASKSGSTLEPNIFKQYFFDRVQKAVGKEKAGQQFIAITDPGAKLGVILGTLGNLGRNKVTIITSPGIHDLGAWLEQLIAESTGKQGKGLVPVDREILGPPAVYGEDRVFAYLRLASDPDLDQRAKVDALRKAGQAVVEIELADTYDLGQEFFRWEIATAVAGSILKINPFNQPDVEASKIVTRQLTEEYEKAGRLPAENPLMEENGIKLFTDERNATNLKKLAGNDHSLTGLLRAHLGQLGAGDYLALLAYVEMNSDHEDRLQRMRHAVRDRKHVATCLGFGPRFLHSTGQAYKGGPNTGVFLQITCDDATDLPVPGQKYTFGTVKAAQARGDFQVLADRKRRALRVHLPKAVDAGLTQLG